MVRPAPRTRQFWVSGAALFHFSLFSLLAAEAIATTTPTAARPAAPGHRWETMASLGPLMQALQSGDNATRRAAEAQWFAMVEADEVAVRVLCRARSALSAFPRRA